MFALGRNSLYPNGGQHVTFDQNIAKTRQDIRELTLTGSSLKDIYNKAKYPLNFICHEL